jgi:hypothetical protein
MKHPGACTFREALMLANQEYAQAVVRNGEELPSIIEQVIIAHLLDRLKRAHPDIISKNENIVKFV